MLKTDRTFCRPLAALLAVQQVVVVIEMRGDRRLTDWADTGNFLFHLFAQRAEAVVECIQVGGNEREQVLRFFAAHPQHDFRSAVGFFHEQFVATVLKVRGSGRSARDCAH